MANRAPDWLNQAQRNYQHAVIWYPGHDLLLGDVVRAENCHLYDSEGKKYVDLESGVWCTAIGHGNPRILRLCLGPAAGRQRTEARSEPDDRPQGHRGLLGDARGGADR
ncbi:MAG: aminotransferase class III-fold pyridoxal phosphate-dependent enzyme [Bacillota bacterium]